MPARNTGTRINDDQGNNRTASHLATNITVVVNGHTIGAIQNLEVQERRPNIRMISEVGTDGLIDSAPAQSTEYTINCQRVRFNRMRVAEAFGRSFTHVKSQRIPFDIEIHDRFHDADEGNSIITTIQNCWIESIGYIMNSQDWIITDTMGIKAEDISSVYAQSNNVVGQTNARGEPIIINPFEQQADRGEHRGALDSPGLLNAFLADSV